MVMIPPKSHNIERSICGTKISQDESNMGKKYLNSITSLVIMGKRLRNIDLAA